MTVEQAYKRAVKKSADMPLLECYDIGDRWVFYFDDNPEGSGGVPFWAVNKDTGEVSRFSVPPMKNLALLQAGKKIEIEFVGELERK